MLLLRNTEEIPAQSIGSHMHLISISTAKEIDESGFLADSLSFETPRNGPYYKIRHLSFPLGQLRAWRKWHVDKSAICGKHNWHPYQPGSLPGCRPPRAMCVLSSYPRFCLLHLFKDTFIASSPPNSDTNLVRNIKWALPKMSHS